MERCIVGLFFRGIWRRDMDEEWTRDLEGFGGICPWDLAERIGQELEEL